MVRGPAHLGQRHRRRAGGPRTQGNAAGGGPAARAPRETRPDAGQRPVQPRATRPMRASGPRTQGTAPGCGPAARAPWGNRCKPAARAPGATRPDAGQWPVHPGEYYRRRAGGPRTLGNAAGGGPEARVPWATLPEAGRRPAYPGEYYRRRAGGPRTLVDDLSGVMLNVPLAVVIPPPPPSSPI